MTHIRSQFLLTAFEDQGVTRLAAAGRLVLGRGAEWDRWAPFLEYGSGGRILADLTGVTELDAAGIGVLVRVAKEARCRGREFSIVAASARVHRFIEATHLQAALRVAAPDALSEELLKCCAWTRGTARLRAPAPTVWPPCPEDVADHSRRSATSGKWSDASRAPLPYSTAHDMTRPANCAGTNR